MPRKKNKLCCHEQNSVLKKIRARKDLNADALYRAIREEFKKIPEFRAGHNISTSIADSLLSAFAMFSLKIPTLLQFDKRRKDEIECQNIKNIFGIETEIPCDTTMREINDEIDPKEFIGPAYKAIFQALQRSKELEKMVFYDGCFLLNLDGTGIFSSKNVSAPYCMQKINKKTGEITYYLQMLGAAIIHPAVKVVIPLMPEMIEKQDGQTKNDCERNGAKRFFEQLRKDHPHLGLIINEDALSPNAPHIKELERNNLHYILGVKPSDHLFLFNYVEKAVEEKRTLEYTIADANNPDIAHSFRILNDVPLNASNQDVRVNFIEYWEHSVKQNKAPYHNSWVTDFNLNEGNAFTIMQGGRARWKIENETFNTLKNQGYNLEHNFGLGQKYLAAVFAMLMVLAFLVDQIQQLCCPFFKAALKKSESKKRLWESIRSFLRCYRIQSMAAIHMALFKGIQAAQLEDVIIDTS